VRPPPDPVVAVVDCEALRDAVVAQPANTVSSLAYLVAASVLVRRMRAGELPVAFSILAAATAAQGVGSAAFHGVGGPAASAVHDAALVSLVAFVAAWHAGRLLAPSPPGIAPAGGPDRWAAGWGGSAAVAGLPFVAWWPARTNLVVALGVTATAGAEVLARRRGLGPVLGRPLAVVGLAAVAAWWSGRTGGVLCRPGSLLQPHAAWHVLSAAAIVVWAGRAAGVPPTTSTGVPPSARSTGLLSVARRRRQGSGVPRRRPRPPGARARPGS
jgi:hypothetical protein